MTCVVCKKDKPDERDFREDDTMLQKPYLLSICDSCLDEGLKDGSIKTLE